jgi:hypothetical protein
MDYSLDSNILGASNIISLKGSDATDAKDLDTLHGHAKSEQDADIVLASMSVGTVPRGQGRDAWNAMGLTQQGIGTAKWSTAHSPGSNGIKPPPTIIEHQKVTTSYRSLD